MIADVITNEHEASAMGALSDAQDLVKTLRPLDVTRMYFYLGKAAVFALFRIAAALEVLAEQARMAPLR